MLTIFIDNKYNKLLAEDVQKKLKRTYTSGGSILPSVLGYTFTEYPQLKKTDYIELDGVMYEAIGVSKIRFFGGKGESMQPVQQIFLRLDD